MKMITNMVNKPESLGGEAQPHWTHHCLELSSSLYLQSLIIDFVIVTYIVVAAFCCIIDYWYFWVCVFHLLLSIYARDGMYIFFACLILMRYVES